MILCRGATCEPDMLAKAPNRFFQENNQVTIE